MRVGTFSFENSWQERLTRSRTKYLNVLCRRKCLCQVIDDMQRRMKAGLGIREANQVVIEFEPYRVQRRRDTPIPAMDPCLIASVLDICIATRGVIYTRAVFIEGREGGLTGLATMKPSSDKRARRHHFHRGEGMINRA